jgi:cyanuric acid amidohydrolase
MRVPVVDLHVCPMRTPSDVSAVRELFDAGDVDPRDVIALVGKTEGSGLGKDTGREMADRALRALLAERLEVSTSEVGDHICVILSGGTPGVITPHVAVVTRRYRHVESTRNDDGRLVAGLGRSPSILPEEVGRTGQIHKVADAVRAAMSDAGMTDPNDVHLVLVKGPSLTAEGIAGARSRGHDTVTADLSIGPEGAICYSNDASALGVAVALDEMPESVISDEVVRRDWGVYSDVAMTSSGGEKDHAEVLLFGNSTTAAGTLRIGHRSMTDILDADAVTGALASAGMTVEGRPTSEQTARIVYLLAKMIIPGGDRLRGLRITMQDDPMGYHVAKAMGGYLIASATGKTMCFVSGGERNSHQGPPEGNPLAAIVRMS